MHAGNDKKLKYQPAKFQIAVDPHSQPYTALQRNTASGNQAPKEKNPLLPQMQGITSTQTVPTNKHRANLSSYQFTGRVDNIDLHDMNDPLAVTEYVEEIYEHFRKQEEKTMVLPMYMESTQSQINEKMRAILVDWLVEVHMKFRLVPETLFLTVNLIDRFLERSEVARPNLQLLGVSCLLIAAKYEEIWPPGVNELVYICDSAYTRTDVSSSLSHHPSTHTTAN